MVSNDDDDDDDTRVLKLFWNRTQPFERFILAPLSVILTGGAIMLIVYEHMFDFFKRTL